MEMNSARKGAVLAITGSILWGIMGAVCQYLLQEKHVTPIWLVNMRLFFAGIILLALDYGIYHKSFFDVWYTRKSMIQLLIFSFITVMGVQFAYLSAVQQMDAAMATVFVSLAPVMTILWVCARDKQWPVLSECICCISAVVGAIIMATHGEFTTLAVSEIGLLWGVLLPFAGVVYTVQPGYLMKKYRPSNVTGWGLLISGVTILPFVKPWELPVEPDWGMVSATAYTVVFGTAVAFWTFLASLRYIKPHIAAIYELIEPFSAIMLTVWLLGVRFEMPEMIGTTMIILPVVYLSMRKS